MLNGKFYLFGGKGTETLVTEYDPVKNLWVTKKPLPNPRYYHATAIFSGTPATNNPPS
ncbi:MAG: hypothetical protein GY866_41850 [Proteobacteria bacterium]|nr:hypothetical protein [Pseudomonadota bacterium]